MRMAATSWQNDWNSRLLAKQSSWNCTTCMGSGHRIAFSAVQCSVVRNLTLPVYTALHAVISNEHLTKLLALVEVAVYKHSITHAHTHSYKPKSHGANLAAHSRLRSH